MRLFLLELFIFLAAFPLFSQTQPVVALLPLDAQNMPSGKTEGTVPVKQVMQGLEQNLLGSAAGIFDLKSISQVPEDFDPSLPPAPGTVDNADYSLSFALFYDTRNNQSQCQVWLYDVKDQKLVVTDQFIYTNALSLKQNSFSLIDYLFGLIPGKLEDQDSQDAEPDQSDDVSGPAPDSASFSQPDNGMPERPLYISAGYQGSLLSAGRLANKTGFQFLPIGAEIRASMLFWNFSWGSLGLSENLAFKSIDIKKTKHYKGRNAGLNFDCVGVIPLGNLFELEAEAGMGFDLTWNWTVDGKNEGHDAYPFIAPNIGLGLNYFIWQGLYLRAGVGLKLDIDTDGSFNLYLPLGLDIGWKFD
jgi:hypothetical protein